MSYYALNVLFTSRDGSQPDERVRYIYDDNTPVVHLSEIIAIHAVERQACVAGIELINQVITDRQVIEKAADDGLLICRPIHPDAHAVLRALNLYGKFTH